MEFGEEEQWTYILYVTNLSLNSCWLSPIHEQELIWLFICVDFIWWFFDGLANWMGDNAFETRIFLFHIKGDWLEGLQYLWFWGFGRWVSTRISRVWVTDTIVAQYIFWVLNLVGWLVQKAKAFPLQTLTKLFCL